MDNEDKIAFSFSEDGIDLKVRLDEDTVWLTQQAMAELFQTSKQNISFHVNNVFKSLELQADRTVKKYLTIQNEGSRRISRKIEYLTTKAD